MGEGRRPGGKVKDGRMEGGEEGEEARGKVKDGRMEGGEEGERRRRERS